jgi:hypothetical protein
VLIPKEHGAYGQLAFPTLTALAAGRSTAAALAVAISAFSAFLAHEPLLVLLGQRGARAAREQRRRARWSLIVFGGSAGIFGVAAVAAAAPAVRAALVVPLALAGLLTVIVAARRERTTAGECLAAVTLSSASLPVGMAGGLPADAASSIALVFAAAFAVATISVRAIITPIARAGGPGRTTAALVIAAALALLIALRFRGSIAPGAVPAVLPVCAVSAGLIVRPAPVRRLRAVGWALVAATALTALILIVQLRQVT